MTALTCESLSSVVSHGLVLVLILNNAILGIVVSLFLKKETPVVKISKFIDSLKVFETNLSFAILIILVYQGIR